MQRNAGKRSKRRRKKNRKKNRRCCFFENLQMQIRKTSCMFEIETLHLVENLDGTLYLVGQARQHAGAQQQSAQRQSEESNEAVTAQGSKEKGLMQLLATLDVPRSFPQPSCTLSFVSPFFPASRASLPFPVAQFGRVRRQMASPRSSR